MFDQLVESSDAPEQDQDAHDDVHLRSLFTWLLIIVLVIIPLPFPETLSGSMQQLTFLVAPPPPPPPPPATRCADAGESGEARRGRRNLPVHLWKFRKRSRGVVDEGPPPDTAGGWGRRRRPGGVPGGQIGGVIGGVHRWVSTSRCASSSTSSLRHPEATAEGSRRRQRAASEPDPSGQATLSPLGQASAHSGRCRARKLSSTSRERRESACDQRASAAHSVSA
mgnify:CR=1 FL=1